MNLTDQQVSILSVCAICQARLDNDQVRAALEEGRTTPMQAMCGECHHDQERRYGIVFQAGMRVLGNMCFERIEKTGLTDEFEAAANKIVADTVANAQLRHGNEQN